MKGKDFGIKGEYYNGFHTGNFGVMGGFHAHSTTGEKKKKNKGRKADQKRRARERKKMSEEN